MHSCSRLQRQCIFSGLGRVTCRCTRSAEVLWDSLALANERPPDEARQDLAPSINLAALPSTGSRAVRVFRLHSRVHALPVLPAQLIVNHTVDGCDGCGQAEVVGQWMGSRRKEKVHVGGKCRRRLVLDSIGSYLLCAACSVHYRACHRATTSTIGAFSFFHATSRGCK